MSLDMLQAAMRTPVRLKNALVADYGFGTRIGLTDGRRKIGQTARYPKDDVTVAVLLKTERANASLVATVHPGVDHHAESRLSAVGAGLFFAADQPSIELHLQAQDHDALAYGRYHNGWFVRLATRDGPLGNRIHRRGSGT